MSIPRGQRIATPSGSRLIEDVRPGQEILCVKQGETVTRLVVAKNRTSAGGKTFEYDLGSVGSLRVNEEQSVFGAIDDPKGSYVYLMHRAGMGFRVGVTRTVGRHGNNFIVRTQQEMAERLWILAWCSTYDEAAEREAYWAYEHGIPREPFRPREDMWSGSEVRTVRLFKRFGENGWKVLQELGLDFHRPNYFAKAKSSVGSALRMNRIAINLLLGTKDGTRVEVETRQVTPTVAKRLGMLPTQNGTLRTRRTFPQLVDARTWAEHLAVELDGSVVESLSGTPSARKMMAIPAASLFPRMVLPVITKSGKLDVVHVQGRKEFPADVSYELVVDSLGMFVANGVVVQTGTRAGSTHTYPT